MSWFLVEDVLSGEPLSLSEPLPGRSLRLRVHPPLTVARCSGIPDSDNEPSGGSVWLLEPSPPALEFELADAEGKVSLLRLAVQPSRAEAELPQVESALSEDPSAEIAPDTPGLDSQSVGEMPSGPLGQMSQNVALRRLIACVRARLEEYASLQGLKAAYQTSQRAPRAHRSRSVPPVQGMLERFDEAVVRLDRSQSDLLESLAQRLGLRGRELDVLRQAFALSRELGEVPGWFTDPSEARFRRLLYEAALARLPGAGQHCPDADAWPRLAARLMRFDAGQEVLDESAVIELFDALEALGRSIQVAGVEIGLLLVESPAAGRGVDLPQSVDVDAGMVAAHPAEADEALRAALGGHLRTLCLLESRAAAFAGVIQALQEGPSLVEDLSAAIAARSALYGRLGALLA